LKIKNPDHGPGLYKKLRKPTNTMRVIRTYPDFMYGDRHGNCHDSYG